MMQEVAPLEKTPPPHRGSDPVIAVVTHEFLERIIAIALEQRR